MTTLTAFRDRFSRSSASVPESARGDASAEAADDGDPIPFAGYGRLNAKQVRRALSDHSQIELEAAEGYERSHKDRAPVLDKLRYLRGREPLPGYDALNVEEIVDALEEADLATITRIRGYERKFANRPQVLAEVARVHHRRRATQPASAVPAYQPVSARIRSSPAVDRPEGSDRP